MSYKEYFKEGHSQQKDTEFDFLTFLAQRTVELLPVGVSLEERRGFVDGLAASWLEHEEEKVNYFYVQ